MAADLAALTIPAQAVCDVMLGAGRADSQLALCLDEARHRCLISEGIHSGVLAALTSIGSHYNGVDFDAVGQGYMSRKSDAEILAIGNFTARGAEVLASKVSAATVHLQYQASGA